MTSLRVRNGWVGRLMALLGLLCLLTACSTTTTVVATPAAPPSQSEDDDFSQLIAQLRADLNRNTSRTGNDKKPLTTATADTKKERDRAFSARANALFAPLNGTGLRMPVVGITARNLYNSWHEPRDGGRRKHKGIDIFAPRGTAVVAVTNGII